MATYRVGVLLGDPNLPYSFSNEGVLGEEEYRAFVELKEALNEIEQEGVYTFQYFSDHESLIDDLRKTELELALNFCDTGYRNNWSLVTHIPSLLEMFEIPFTGSNGFALDLTSDKSLLRTLGQNLGIPVPDEIFIDLTSSDLKIPDRYPVLIKPNVGAGSFGMTKDCVVHNEAQAKAYLHWLGGKIDAPEALIQEFLTGREYTVGVIGNHESGIEILPVAEIDYEDLPKSLPPVFSYEAKFEPTSPYWQNLHHKKADLNESTFVELAEYTKKICRRMGVRDYARLDFREDAEGNVKLLDVNPNPTWYADSRMAMMSEWAGYNYQEMLKLILQTAFKRYPSLHRRLAA